VRFDRRRTVLCFVCDVSAIEFPDRLRPITDETWSYVDVVQIRGKTLSAGELENAARCWVRRLRDLMTLVIVNDRVDVALATGADGAHLGRSDLGIRRAREVAGEGFILGASTHNREQLLEAQDAGADYAGLGAFYPSPTKHDTSGITAKRIPAVLEVPVVTGVAVGSAIQHAADPARAIRDLSVELRRGTVVSESQT
jgi:thiamine-phosphate pyrophosphorylase